MIEMAIIAMIVSSVTMRVAGNVAVDGFFAARGKESPRYTRAKARRTPGAASRYWSQVWDDSWDSMLQSHNRRVARRVDKPDGPTLGDRWKHGSMRFRHARWNAHNRFKRGMAPLVDRWDEGWEKRRTKATRPRPEYDTVPGTVVPNAEDGDGDRPQDRPVPDPSSVPTEDDAPVPDEDGTVPQDDNRNSDPEDDMYETKDFDLGPEANRQYETAARRNMNDHIRQQRTPTTEGPTMTTMPSTEIVGLEPAITFFEASSHAYTEQSVRIGDTLSALQGFGLSGPALADAASAMDMSQSCAASSARVASELRKHRAIPEAIDAVTGAADSMEFYKAGR